MKVFFSLLSLCSFPLISAVNSVVNGDFQQSFNGWTRTGGLVTSAGPDGSLAWVAQSSDYNAQDGIQQTITGLTVGNTYVFSFDARTVIKDLGKYSLVASFGQFVVDIGCQVTTDFKTYQWRVTPTQTSLSLGFSGWNYRSFFVVDNVSIDQISHSTAPIGGPARLKKRDELVLSSEEELSSPCNTNILNSEFYECTRECQSQLFPEIA
ncbi:hypothetical protein BT69DRAFT_1282682 [Atractiella rhizophila]|nr:hypothetical protein BT69DRAFT_1282682 [Atractiella rhizophila]